MSGIVVRGRDEYESEQVRKDAILKYLEELERPCRKLPYEQQPDTIVQNSGVTGVRVVGPDHIVAELAARLRREGFAVHDMNRFDWELRNGWRDQYGQLR